ncbi:MAG: multicopper oxidase family protein, partial [Anaerolineales bacterium]
MVRKLNRAILSGTTFSRRSFLKLAGLTALAAATNSCRPNRQPTPIPTSAPFGRPEVEIALTAKQAQWELAPGKVITAWTYNGKVPGEAIRVREGDRVRVTLKNDLPEPTTVHWHGIDVPTNMDGVPDISQPAVQPGETFTYEFEAQPAGTRWYHTHFNSAKQMDLGLYAPFIIEPPTPDTPTDREYTLLLDDWVTGTTTPNASPTEDGMMGGAPNGVMGGGMMGGDSSGGMMGGMMGNTGPAYDTFTVNGKAFPVTEPLKVKQGERVRLRLINASNMQTFVIRLAGHRLQ